LAAARILPVVTASRPPSVPAGTISTRGSSGTLRIVSRHSNDIPSVSVPVAAGVTTAR
jgi:hypothetical protein